MQTQDTISIALIQQHIRNNQRAVNLSAFGSMIETLPKNVSIIVLPEFFATGFINADSPHVERHLGPTVEWMHGYAKQLNALVCGTVIARDGDKTYNRFYFAFPDGNTQWYDKRHLFTYAGENKEYTPGHERKIFNYLGWRICPQVCYDIRFPAWNRNLHDYDLLIYSASFPAARDLSWRTLLAARAIENQAYTVGCNRVGADDEGQSYRGSSQINAPTGRLMAHIATNASGIVLGQCSLTQLNKYRQEFPFLADSDSFTLHINGMQ